ncbi:Gfo/Idh/MocA family oxidoreductase [Mucilaginibacter robiniae]|uniref:Gfo/Idh/MocA family oxidoreductase n=1 Tax=Mucilaginibacter robiniae TaxID=2728022 RepID=A0A7L5DWD7_9SPHI|nr:Gfo/Idh/MocA family oxidoreductase [Mucilaginibacter robiniae]QJD95392.1 Gfo/Idh/MocA family oxidoreductase [Mucilaginibacter robiniae]
MKNINQLMQSFLSSSGECNRREFLENAGKGLMAATVIGELASCTADAQNMGGGGMHKSMADTIRVQVPSQHAATERQQETGTAMIEPDKRIGYAIVGLGELTIGQIMPAFGACKYAKPVALISGHPDKAQKVAAQYGINPKNIYDYQNFDQIKNNPKIEAVYIVLPNGMHEEFVTRAAQAGKHVLCEKPMANSSKEAERMIAACKKAGKKLMIAYRIQYEPHNRMAMKWTREKHFGKVKVISSTNVQNIGDPSQWRLKKALSGGGSLPDIGLYNINTNRFLLGEEPHTVVASTYSTPNDPRFKEVEEAVMFQMFFPSGAIANNVCSYGVHNSKNYRCFADNGGWFGLDPAFDYEGLKMEASQAQGKIEMKQNPIISDKKQFALEMDHFAQCIMENNEPYTPGEEGLQDHKIMEAIYESARTGKPVKLEMITTLDTFRHVDNAPKES